MPASRRRPWRHDFTFAPPPVRRLSAPALRDWCGFIHAVRRKRLISPGRLSVAKQLLQFVGWRGRGQVALAELASAAEVSDDTVGRALNDLEQLGLVRRHHLLRRDEDGRTVQDASFFELIAPPEFDPQSAEGRIPYGLSLSFLAWKRVRQDCGRVVTMVEKGLRKGRAQALGGDDEWARGNAARQLALLAAEAGCS